MEEKETFTIVDENNNAKEAEILTVIEVNNQEYVVYSVEENTEEESIYVSKIVKNLDGSEDVIEIENEEERNQIHQIVTELINKEE